MVLTLPAEMLAPAPVAKPRQYKQLKGALRRDIVTRYGRTYKSYPHAKAFAVEEQRRLAIEEGIIVHTGALEACVSRSNTRTAQWEQLREFLTEGWKDTGAIRQHFGWSSNQWLGMLAYLRRLGYPVVKAATSPAFRRETGWSFQYRIPPRVEA